MGFIKTENTLKYYITITDQSTIDILHRGLSDVAKLFSMFVHVH